jgi:hypothetical protein
MICKNTPGHLLWMKSHPHVLEYQGPFASWWDEDLQLIVPNWGLIYASNTATEGYVLRFTLKGFADFLYCIKKVSYYLSSEMTLCRHTMMEVTERTKSELGGWSILDPSMGEQDEELDCELS